MNSMFLSQSWCRLSWSPWIIFEDRALLRKELSPIPGMYRVKPAGFDHLSYIGQTNNLRRRLLNELIPHSLADPMPFNDPHTAAQSLWAWHDAEGYTYEISVAGVDLDQRERQGLECYLIWQYRLAVDETTQCNLGRFPPGYFRSTNRKDARRGGRLPAGSVNPASGPSLPPLLDPGRSLNLDWMGLHWSEPCLLENGQLQQVPTTPGVYRLLPSNADRSLYIGQTHHLPSRLRQHADKSWPEGIYFSYAALPEDILPHQLHELENDLIGGYWNQYGQVPKYQFTNFH